MYKLVPVMDCTFVPVYVTPNYADRTVPLLFPQVGVQIKLLL